MRRIAVSLHKCMSTSSGGEISTRINSFMFLPAHYRKSLETSLAQMNEDHVEIVKQLGAIRLLISIGSRY